MTGRHKIIPIFVPHKGCPNDCIFCNQKKISGQIEDMTVQKIPQIIEAHLATIDPDDDIEIAFYGGSFTAIDPSIQESFLTVASKYLSDTRIKQIRISTRPDCIDGENLRMLWHYGVRTIELGVQSLENEVLRASFRGHDVACVYEAAALIKRMGFTLGIQTMTGLPGDTDETCLDTARKVIGISPEIVRIYHVLVIRGTELERQYLSGSYRPQGLEEAVNLCAQLLQLYEDNQIKVIRVGLQPTDTIREGSGSDVVAGPMHPAFRQLVEARLMRGRIEAAIEKQGLAGTRNLTVCTGISNISNVIGQNRSNIHYLKERYSIGHIKVLPQENLTRELILLGE
jgi:histone acetyltransferase (RNA polymerase elongator complex component)